MTPWIDVKDELPPKGMPCLLYQSYPASSMFNCRADPLSRCFYKIGGLRYENKWVLYEDQYSESGIQHVSHWMPLPKVTEEKNNKETK